LVGSHPARPVGHHAGVDHRARRPADAARADVVRVPSQSDRVRVVARPGAGGPARELRDGQIFTTRVGLRIPDRLAFEAWQAAGAQIARVVDSSAWCLGDWLVYGERRFIDRYRDAVAAVGLEYQTLRNYAWVTRRFELSRRRQCLTFQHHAEVASLSSQEQDEWLDRAERGGWSRNQLRKAVRDARQDALAPAGTAPRWRGEGCR